MPEVKIHLELILPAERLSVNALIALFQQLLRQLVPQLVAAWLGAWQDLELTRWLGSRWNPAQQGTHTVGLSYLSVPPRVWVAWQPVARAAQDEPGPPPV